MFSVLVANMNLESWEILEFLKMMKSRWNLPAWWMDPDDVAALSCLVSARVRRCLWLLLSCCRSRFCCCCCCSEAGWSVRWSFGSFHAGWSFHTRRSSKPVSSAAASSAVLGSAGAEDGDTYGHWRWSEKLHCIVDNVRRQHSTAPIAASGNGDFVGCETPKNR